MIKLFNITQRLSVQPNLQTTLKPIPDGEDDVWRRAEEWSQQLKRRLHGTLTRFDSRSFSSARNTGFLLLGAQKPLICNLAIMQYITSLLRGSELHCGDSA